MGNKHSKRWALRKWGLYDDEIYTQFSTRRSRLRSRKASRQCVFLETIEEEWPIPDDDATAQNSQDLPLPEDTETHPVAQMPPEALQVPDASQPATLMDLKPKEAQVEMERIQEAKSDLQEQPYPVTVFPAEDPVLPRGSAPGKRKRTMKERVSQFFYNRAKKEKPEEAEIVKKAEYGIGGLHGEDDALKSRKETETTLRRLMRNICWHPRNSSIPK